jgi:hypothetical protein
MALLVLLTLLVLVTSIAVTSAITSRAETVLAASLVFNAIIILPIYVLGLAGHLDRLTLGLSTSLESVGLLAIFASRNGGAAFFRTLPRRALTLALLPVIAIRRVWQERSFHTVTAIVALAAFPYMILVSYLAPAWRDWDGLWYHEPLIGLTIQNHGFAPEPLPGGLQVINGVHRLSEMTQLWFGIYGGRRVIEMANVFFMPLYAASVFVLVRRYSNSITSSVAWASALVLLPGYLRLVQTSLVDPHACALLIAAAYYVTHPKLDRQNALYAILGTTLAAGAKIWSIVPVGILSVFLLVRLLRRTRANGGAATAGLLGLGSVCVLGIQAITYVRNLILFKNPVWPMISYDNPKLGIHWAGGLPLDFQKTRGGVDFNEPFAVFYKKMLAPPYSVMGPGHYWQVNDYGFAWAWVVLPVFALVVFMIVVRWIRAFLAVRVLRLRPPGPADQPLSSAMMLAVVAATSLYLSPAILIARYPVASLAPLLGRRGAPCLRRLDHLHGLGAHQDPLVRLPLRAGADLEVAEHAVSEARARGPEHPGGAEDARRRREHDHRSRAREGAHEGHHHRVRLHRLLRAALEQRLLEQGDVALVDGGSARRRRARQREVGLHARRNEALLAALCEHALGAHRPARGREHGLRVAAPALKRQPRAFLRARVQ